MESYQRPLQGMLPCCDPIRQHQGGRMGEEQRSTGDHGREEEELHLDRQSWHSKSEGIGGEDQDSPDINFFPGPDEKDIKDEQQRDELYDEGNRGGFRNRNRDGH